MRRIMPPLRRLASVVALAAMSATPAHAQWSTTYEQFYLQASHNWVFRSNYASADRLFNAFDFGHAILYETLWTKPGAPAEELEGKRYRQLTEKILVNPPRLPLEEAAIEPKYAQLAPEAKVMFDWAHLLHRQLYDVLADERMDWPTKDVEIARLVRYYRSRPDLAFSSQPKTMRLMQEQPYSLAFRKGYPKFNGLIWGYHWLQMGLYEPLMVGRSVAEKQSLVRATVARFFQMLQDAPRTLPHQMPMTVAVSPTFAARYPEAAIIFDNLHSMHDVVSDILANPSVPRREKRAAILRAARAYRDNTTEVMTPAAWRTMSLHMGIENMGGPSVGFLPALPSPSVTAGAVMQHDPTTGAMTGFAFGSAVGGAMDHGAMDHAAMGHVMPPAAPVEAPTRTWSDDDVRAVRDALRTHAQLIEVASLLETRAQSSALRALGHRVAAARRAASTDLSQWLVQRSIASAPLPDVRTTPPIDALLTTPAARFDTAAASTLQQLLENALRIVNATGQPTASPRDAALVALFTQLASSLEAEQQAARTTPSR
jgi:hypothetical protein